MSLRMLERNRQFVPKRILLTRLSAIGDCILTIPVAVRAKQLWPDSKLTWVVDCGVDQLLEEHPAVDEVLRIKRRWLKRPGEWLALRRELRSRKFDLVLDPQGLSKSALIGWLSGARRRVGFDYSHAREVAPLVATRRIRRTTRHLGDTYLQVLSDWCDIVPGEGKFDMPRYPEASAHVAKLLEDMGFEATAASPWVAINPGAGWPTRLWPVQRFGVLARDIYRRHGRKSLVFWAGDEEYLMAKVIEEESQGGAVAAPRTNMRELAELLRRASLLVTGETGPMHLASALGTPCVSLHGPTWADESGPYGNRHVGIQSPSPTLSKKFVRRGPNLAMQAIETEEVLHACSRLILGERTAGDVAA